MSLNEFASRSNQEDQKEIATEKLDKSADLQEKGIDGESVEEIEEDKTSNSVIENDQKTSVNSKEKVPR